MKLALLRCFAFYSVKQPHVQQRAAKCVKFQCGALCGKIWARQKRSNGILAVDVLGAAEIELRITLLPPISRGTHLAGPRLQAKRLVALWKADGEVTLGEAFRLLDVETVVGVLCRTLAEREYRGDPRYWHFPPFADLLSALREAAWQEILAGKLVLEAIKGLRGRRHQPLAPAALARLTPDWELARLVRDGRDEFIEVMVRSMPATAIPRPWQPKPASEQIKTAAEAIAKAYPPPDSWLPFPKFWAELDARVGAHVSRRRALRALDDHAPHLRVKPGIRVKPGQTGKNKSPS